MKKLSSLILTAAMLLTLSACDIVNLDSDLSSGNSDSSDSAVQSGVNPSAEGSSSEEDDNPFLAMSEWDYVTLVRDNYRRYYIASSSSEGGLPNVASNLLVRSLESAVSDDESGQLRVLLGKFIVEPSLSERLELCDTILNVLCETDKITDTNEYFSDKKLAVLEGFWGTGDKFPAPSSEITAQPLEEAYTFLVERYCMAMIGSQILDYIDLIGSTPDSSGKYQADMSKFNERIAQDYKSGLLSDKQLADNVVYLAYYGVLKDKTLMMLDEFREYADAEIPEAESVINSAVGDAAELFSGINDIEIK